MIVLHASAVIAWAYREEGDWLDSLIREVSANAAIVPVHWLLEVVNALLLGERRRRLRPGQRDEILAHIQRLPIRADEETTLRGWREIPALAERYGLTSYDAAYLELALRVDAPLATMDQDLARAARAAKVRLFAT